MNKVIRLQIDMVYSVDENSINEVEEKDKAFLAYIEDMFYSWQEANGEPRQPIEIDTRYHIGEQKESDEEVA